MGRKLRIGVQVALVLALIAVIYITASPTQRAEASITGIFVARDDSQNPVNLLRVSEDGATEKYALFLFSQPTANVTITTSVPWQGEDLSISPASFTFTPDNWNQKQLVTVSAVNDSILEGAETRTINHRAVSADSNYDSGGRDVGSMVVDIADNDVAGVVIEESGNSTDVSEDGASDTYTVSMKDQPWVYTTVTVTMSAGPQLKVTPASLTFSPSNWSAKQTVTVTAIDDFVAENAHTGVITHAASSNTSYYNGIPVQNVTAHIADNDHAGIKVSQTDNATAVTENGATDSYNFVLTSQPTASVTVNIGGGTQVVAAPAAITFTPDNWNVAQSVAVSAVNDFVAEGSHSGKLTHTVASSDSFYDKMALDDVAVAITDDDHAGVTLNETSGQTAVTEGGTTDTYTVTLTSQPTSNVTISASGDEQVKVQPASVVITPSQWNTPQTFTVEAVDDADVEGLHKGTVVHTLASDDPFYKNILVANVAVSITDNDVPKVVVTESGGSTTVKEGEGTDDYSLVLATKPSADVTVKIVAPANLKVSTKAVLFTPANWNELKTVVVSAVDNKKKTGNTTGTILHTIESKDAGYSALLVRSVMVTIIDNDVPEPPAPPVVTPPASETPSGGNAAPPVVTPSAPSPVSSGNAGSVNSGGSSSAAPGASGSPVVGTPSNGGNAVANPPAAISADNLIDLPGKGKQKLSTEVVDAIKPVLDDMLDNKTFVLPSNRTLNPFGVTNQFFATQVALSVADVSCGDTINYATCSAAAVKENLIAKPKSAQASVNTVAYLEMLLKAKDIPLVDTDQIPNKVCADVSKTSSYAKVIATARAYGILEPNAKNACAPTKSFQKYSALLYAGRADAVTDADVSRVEASDDILAK